MAVVAMVVVSGTCAAGSGGGCENDRAVARRKLMKTGVTADAAEVSADALAGRGVYLDAARRRQEKAARPVQTGAPTDQAVSTTAR